MNYKGEDESLKLVDRILEFVIAIFIGWAIGFFIGTKLYKENNSSPVERDNIIDSLNRNRDSIKIKVEHLDSIKNAKVIEVSTLDNDSTLKLFYELVKE